MHNVSKRPNGGSESAGWNSSSTHDGHTGGFSCYSTFGHLLANARSSGYVWLRWCKSRLLSPEGLRLEYTIDLAFGGVSEVNVANTWHISDGHCGSSLPALGFHLYFGVTVDLCGCLVVTASGGGWSPGAPIASIGSRGPMNCPPGVVV